MDKTAGSDPVGDAIAWAQSAAENANRRLERRVEELERRMAGISIAADPRPQDVIAQRMVCDRCWPAGVEIKTKGSGGPCCICHEMRTCGGPISEPEFRLLRAIWGKSAKPPA